MVGYVDFRYEKFEKFGFFHFMCLNTRHSRYIEKKKKPEYVRIIKTVHLFISNDCVLYNYIYKLHTRVHKKLENRQEKLFEPFEWPNGETNK